MPYGEPDPEDPQALVGVEVPADAETYLDMAYAIDEEFAQLGFNERRLLHLFQNPFYRSAYQAGQILGKERIDKIVREVLQIWGNLRVVDREVTDPPLVQLRVPDKSESKR